MQGHKAAMKLNSEGTKFEKYNIGVAEQEATRRVYEMIKHHAVS